MEDFLAELNSVFCSLPSLTLQFNNETKIFFHQCITVCKILFPENKVSSAKEMFLLLKTKVSPVTWILVLTVIGLFFAWDSRLRSWDVVEGRGAGEKCYYPKEQNTSLNALVIYKTCEMQSYCLNYKSFMTHFYKSGRHVAWGHLKAASFRQYTWWIILAFQMSCSFLWAVTTL